jgi:hypothetical protein
MVELEPIPIHATTSSISPITDLEHGPIQSISSSQLACLMTDSSFILVILDCRAGEEVSPVSSILVEKLSFPTFYCALT